MSIHVFDYPLIDPPLVTLEKDGTWSMLFLLSGESLKITGLKKTSLAQIKKSINLAFKYGEPRKEQR